MLRTNRLVRAALYKVATGEDIAKAPVPGMFDLKVRALSLGSRKLVF